MLLSNLQSAILPFCFHSSETTERTSMKLGTIDHDPRLIVTRTGDVTIEEYFLIRSSLRRNA